MACFCGISSLEDSTIVKGTKVLPDDGECDTGTSRSNKLNVCNE
jgi:hypothetical protein